MFDHSDSIRDIIEETKDELKNNPELKKDYQNYEKQRTGDNQKTLVLDSRLNEDPQENTINTLKNINNDILILNEEINQQEILTLNNEIGNNINQDQNVLYLQNEYKPDFSDTLTLNLEVNFDHPLLLKDEVETTLSRDLDKEISKLDEEILAEDPIYEKVDLIDQQQSNIQNKLENIYEKIEQNDSDTDIKLDNLSDQIKNSIIQNIEELKDASVNLNNAFDASKEQIKENIELSLTSHLGPVYENVDLLKSNFDNIHESIISSNEILRQDIHQNNEILKNEIINNNEITKEEIYYNSNSLKSELLDKIKYLEEERERIENERIERENSPQRKLEKKFEEISSVIESQNLKMQTAFATMEMKQNQSLMQSMMQNFMNNLQNYEKKIDEKLNDNRSFENKNHREDHLSNKIDEMEKRFERKFEDMRQASINDNFNKTILNLDRQFEQRQGPQNNNNPVLLENMSENVDLFKKHIDNRFYALENLIENIANFTKGLKDDLSQGRSTMSSGSLDGIRDAINTTIKNEIGLINSKLLKIDDWMNLLNDESFKAVELIEYKELKKIDNIEEAREFVVQELINNTKKWINENKKKIDEIAQNLLF